MTDCSPTDNLTAKFSSTENDVGEEVTCKCRCVAVELFLHHDAFKRTLPLVFFDEHCIDHMRTEGQAEESTSTCLIRADRSGDMCYQCDCCLQGNTEKIRKIFSYLCTSSYSSMPSPF